MRPRKSAPDPSLELPIAFVPCSNGETVPRAPTERDRRAVELFVRRADENARHVGLSRRDFIRSACGFATALGVIDVAYGCSSPDTEVPRVGLAPDASLDPAHACERLSGDELVFDVQTHHVDPHGRWRETDPSGALVAGFPFAACGEPDPTDCFDVEHYVQEVFVRSDTAVACLTGVPADPERDPLPLADRVATREIIDRLSQSSRLLVHANVLPELGAAQLDAMQAAAERQRVAAWKVYPSSGRWRFDDGKIAAPFIEKARALGVKVVCAHRGIAGDAGGYLDLSSPREMAKAALAYPDVAFLAYHAGWEGGIVEGPYDAANPRGIDRMVKALEEFPAKNFYAELGSTFRGLMTDPVQLAHALGKLLRYVGEDRVLWGTDCIWYGSPQEQIAMLRAFEIPASMQEAFGYPALTPAVKRKILGLNAAKVYGVDPDAVRCAIASDDVSKLKRAALEDDRDVPIRSYGPRTRRELLRMLRAARG